MRNLPLMIRILLLILFTGSLYSSNAQSAPGENQNANETIYRWHLVDPFTRLASLEEYKNLPEADYTPAKSEISGWSAAEKLQAFASGISGKLSVICILKVDDAGYIRGVSIKRASNNEQAQALSANILNTKISGPSFFRNKAVASYVPCSVTITNHQITIL